MNVLDAQGGREAENYDPLEELTRRFMVISSKDNEVLVQPMIGIVLAC